MIGVFELLDDGSIIVSREERVQPQHLMCAVDYVMSASRSLFVIAMPIGYYLALNIYKLILMHEYLCK